MELGGIHHLTAVTGRAAANVDFYAGTLGLRLIKKTVNQDDVSAYHLFYGDEIGHPGTEVTFFDWPWASPVRPGVGTVSETALRVPGPTALTWWADRFDELNVDRDPLEDRDGRATLPFVDPEGQRLRLIDDGGIANGTPWPGSPVPAEAQIRGLHGVTIEVGSLEPTAHVLTAVLGFRRAGEAIPIDGGRVQTFETGLGGPGTQVRVVERPGDAAGRVGIGGVHHVAFRTPDEAEHRAWRERIAGAGLGVTPVIDRYYFRSIYFCEPGGILFEIATDGPGFATDENVAALGMRLALPPFLEPRRAEIEAGLRPLPTMTAAHGVR
jgi:glyoxalase family protein